MKRLMAFLLLCILAGQATAAGLFARVDRTQLSIDETLELSLESQGGAVFGKPDLEPLEELFEVFDTRQVNQLSSSNGEARAITRWLITLRPRQTGYVVIPPLQLGDWRSEPITWSRSRSKAAKAISWRPSSSTPASIRKASTCRPR